MSSKDQNTKTQNGSKPNGKNPQGTKNGQKKGGVKELTHLKGASAAQTIKDLTSGALRIEKAPKQQGQEKEGKENQNSVINQLFTPKTELSKHPIEIMRPYENPQFSHPEFYQPPAFRFVRESNRNLNSKQKYYEDRALDSDIQISKNKP